jgi:hypothetical protein
MHKKAQEEMVGFVLVVAVVAVIFLVFLGIALRKPGAEQETTRVDELDLFLDAMLEFSTDCEVAGSSLNVKDLIFHVQKGKLCSPPSLSASQVLNETVKELIEASWEFGDDRLFLDYYIQIVRETSGGGVSSLVSKHGRATGLNNPKTTEKPIGEGIRIILTIDENRN